MFDWDVYARTQELLSGLFGQSYRSSYDHHHVQSTPDRLVNTARLLKDDLNFFLLTDVALVPLTGHAQLQKLWPLAQQEAIFNLFNPESHQRLQLHVPLANDEHIGNMQDVFPAVSFLWNKLNAPEDSGAKARPKLPVIKKNPNLSEAPYAEELYQWLFFDGFHSATLGEMELALAADNGAVKKIWPYTGLGARNIDQRLTAVSLANGLRITDEIQPWAAPISNLAWLKTWEDFFAIKIPERAQAIRMIMIELSRMAGHLSALERMMRLTRHSYGWQTAIELREYIWRLFDFAVGSRVTTSMGVVGGLSQDLPAGWGQECSDYLRTWEKMGSQLDRLFLRDYSVRERLRTGTLSASQALRWGYSGPAMRASGINVDLRKSRPFYFYADVDFDVPVGIHGDAYDRCLIRYEEMRQSARMVAQLLDNLPVGEVTNDDPRLKQLHNGTLSVAEWQAWRVQADRPFHSQYTSLEGVNGETGFHIVLGEQGPGAYYVHSKTATRLLPASLQEVMVGVKVEDLALVLASYNVMASEMDN